MNKSLTDELKTSESKAVFVDVGGSNTIKAQVNKPVPKQHDRMVEKRDDEPGYAKLYDPAASENNRYGTKITLVEEGLGESLKINHNDVIGENPNRNKQHGFHFTADNCIGCHACESACSEKNDLPPHLAFRSVGYVEGGTFPDYTRMNISMACNHCDDPVCLKGCPTRAYTKHPEYGAVIQDPDICFGCGYCTWVCPYNAPQLDPVAGQVEKCNMCVDRLEEGLKPACVSACVGNALDFGVIENTPENREQIETRIPGFPDPEISKPNIRFQQIKNMPREVNRTDSMPIKYKKDDGKGFYKPVVDQKFGKERHWNIKRLSSRENPLVLLTLCFQCAFGLFTALVLGNLLDVESISAVRQSSFYLLAPVVALGLSAIALLMSTSHIGKPLRFYRGFNNLRHSPVSREGLGIFLFLAFTALHTVFLLPQQSWLIEFLPSVFPFSSLAIASEWKFLTTLSSVMGILAVVAGSGGLYYMYRCYRIPARPFWNHWSTGTHFLGNALSLGGTALSVLFLPVFFYQGLELSSLMLVSALMILLGVLIESTGLLLQARELNVAEHEGAASHYIQQTTFGYSYLLRNVSLFASALCSASLLFSLFVDFVPAFVPVLLFLSICVLLAVSALIGRALFYVLVVPTTMPGAFFWKNKAFEEHARDIGLDHNPSSGVVSLSH